MSTSTVLDKNVYVAECRSTMPDKLFEMKSRVMTGTPFKPLDSSVEIAHVVGTTT